MFRNVLVTLPVLAVSFLSVPAATQDQPGQVEQQTGSGSAPQVVSMTPAPGSEVDPATTEFVVVFDRPMNSAGYSVCGGGPTLPKMPRKPTWRDTKTLVLHVELEPDKEYRMSLNCRSVARIKSRRGVVLRPVQWDFTTLPAVLRPVEEQRARNEAALAELAKLIRERYTSRDLRVKDWDGLLEAGRSVVLSARTDRSWAAAVAELLVPTRDVHMSVQYKQQKHAVHRRVSEPSFRNNVLPRYVKIDRISPQAFKARTDDGIGYLLISGWGKGVDVERVGGAIVEMADTKGLVIDVRMNGGGDVEVAEAIARWFVEGEKVYAKRRTRAGAEAFSEPVDRTISGYGENRFYDRPVMLLVGEYVMNSNEAFVLMMNQAADCTVIGMDTYGSIVETTPFELANGVTVTLPTAQTLRPDGTPVDGEGLKPDVFIRATSRELAVGDPILEKAFELIRAKADK